MLAFRSLCIVIFDAASPESSFASLALINQLINHIPTLLANESDLKLREASSKSSNGNTFRKPDSGCHSSEFARRDDNFR